MVLKTPPRISTSTYSFTRNVLGHPASRGPVIVIYGSGSPIAVVTQLAGLVEVVVDHEVGVAVSRVYPDAVALLVASSPTPDRVPLDVVVIAITIDKNAVVCVVAILGIAHYRVETDGIVVAITDTDAMPTVALAAVTGDGIVVARGVQ